MTLSTLQPLNRGVAEITINLKDFIVQAFTFVKDKIVAVALTVFSFLKDTVLPFVQNFAAKTWTFLRTPGGFITAGVALGITLAHLSEKVNGDEQPWVKTGIQVASVASFIGAGVAVGFGFATGFTTVLI